MSDYNGWTNRETWLVNIWFMDDVEGKTSAGDLSDMLDEYLDHIIPTSGFITDMLNLSRINWTELADTHNENVES